MKFTIDLENKKILIHDSFNRKELDELFSLLNIEDMDEFIIDKYNEPTITYPNVPNQPIIQPINPYNPYPDWTYYTTNTDSTNILNLSGATTQTHFLYNEES